MSAPELAGGSRAPQTEPDGKPDDSPGATWEFKKRPRLRIGRDTHIDLTAKLQVDLPTHQVRIESQHPREAFAAALAEEGYAPA